MNLEELDDKELTDNSKMPDKGKYKDVRMVDIPDTHLRFLYENNKCSKKVKTYIENYLL